MSASSGRKPRVVVDTNLFVSGMILKRGHPFALLEAWRANRFQLLLSARQLTELTDVFSRPRLVQAYGLTQAELSELFTDLHAALQVTPAATLPVTVRDPKDEPILAAALGGQADYLVTGDADLLVLAGDPKLGPLTILTVAEFLAILTSAPHP